MALSQTELNKLLKEAGELRKEALDFIEKHSKGEELLAKEIKKTNKEYRAKIDLLKEINDKIQEEREDGKARFENLIRQQESLSSLNGLQSKIKDTETQRINIMAKMPGLNAKFRDTVFDISELQRELVGTSAEEGLKQSYIKEQLDEKYASIEKERGVRGQIKGIMLEQRSIAEGIAGMTREQQENLENQKSVIDLIKKSMGGVLETFDTLTSGPMGALGTGLIGAGFLLEKLGHTAHETGTFFTEMSLSATGLGFIFSDALGVAKGLSAELGGINEAGFKVQLQTNLLANNLHISSDEAVSLMGSFARLNGDSTDIAASTIQATKELAKQHGVIPAQVMADMAGSTKAFAEYGKEGGRNIAEAAVFAAKLGVNMDALTSVTDSLLDFETSMTKELELSALLGRNINMNKARQLAYDGEIGSAVKESLRQMGGIDEFNRMDIFQKRAAADLLGLSVEQYQKMASNANKLNADGSIQLSQTQQIGKKFDYISEVLKGIATGPGGDFLKTLGGGAIAMGQMGFPLKTMGKDMKALAMSAKDTLKSIGSKAWKMLGGGGGAITGAVGNAGGSVASKAKDTIMGSKGSQAGDKIAGKGSITDSIGKMDMNKVLKGAAALVIVAGAVWVFGKAVQEFMKVSWDAVGKSIVSMLSLVGALALLGAVASGPLGAGLLIGAAAMIIVAGAMWILGKAIQEMAIGFSSLGQVGNILSGLIGMIGGIVSLTAALTGLAGSLALVGTAGLIALPGLMALSIAAPALGIISDLLGTGNNNTTETTAIQEGSLSEYEKNMLDKMDKLIKAVSANRDVYLDKEKVTSSVMKQSEKATGNSFGLSVA